MALNPVVLLFIDKKYILKQEIFLQNGWMRGEAIRQSIQRGDYNQKVLCACIIYLIKFLL
jgi:hypothetical protein